MASESIKAIVYVFQHDHEMVSFYGFQMSYFSKEWYQICIYKGSLFDSCAHREQQNYINSGDPVSM